LNSELKGIAFRLRITIEYDAVKKGQKWSEIKRALKMWIVRGAPTLIDGRHLIENVPGIPFRMHITKQSDRPPGIFVRRPEPYDNTLAIRVRNLLDRKIDKLAKYNKPGTTTLLLVESEDTALMNESKMLDVIKESYRHGFPESIDQVWYADTSIRDDIEFCDFTKELERS